MDSEPASTPRQRGINRIIVGVWDFAAGIDFYSNLLGVSFDVPTTGDAAAYGVQVAISWDAGIELVSPLPDRPSDLRRTLEERGEGIVGVVFAVADADAARDAAVGLGMPSYHSLDFDQEQLDDRYPGRFRLFKEHFITPVPPLSGTVLLGEFAPSPD